MNPDVNRARGFTLLEVLVALTITGFALGALLGVIGGNKRLAWRSEAVLLEATRARVEINLAQLTHSSGSVPRELPAQSLHLENVLELEAPERKTQGSMAALRRFEVRDADDEVLSAGVHWMQLTRPE